MLQHVLNLNGVKLLEKQDQKNVNGGRRSKPTSSNCINQPNGTRCFYNNHPNCPGLCSSGFCNPL